MKNITYNIEKGKAYFNNTSVLVDELLEASQKKVCLYIYELKEFIARNEIEKLRSYEEYLFDMLSYGAYWEIYSGIAEKTWSVPVSIARKLYYYRQKNKNYKKYIDPVRGFIFTAFLYKPQNIGSAEYNNSNARKFYNWLDATGEFREEVKRFAILEQFNSSKTLEQKKEWFCDITKLVDYFDLIRGKYLGAYTEELTGFLSSELHKYR